MALFIEIVIAVVIFVGVFSLLAIGGVAAALGGTFIAILKLVLIVAAIIWLVRLIGRLLG